MLLNRLVAENFTKRGQSFLTDEILFRSVRVLYGDRNNLSFLAMTLWWLKKLCGYFFLIFFGRNDAKAETPVLWPPHAKKRLWCWEGLGAGGEGDDRGWDGWMPSLTRWMWVWVNSGSWWWTGRPGVLYFMGSQRVGHNWATELNWTDLRFKIWLKFQSKIN